MKRSFVVYHESWFYNRNCDPEIWIMVGDDDDDFVEFCISWKFLDCPKIEVFPESIQGMLACTDLFKEIYDIEIGESDKYWNYSPDAVKQMLLDLGFQDVTQREDPEAVKVDEVVFDKDKVWELFNNSPEFREYFVEAAEKYFGGKPR